MGEYSRVLRDSKRTLSRKRTIDGSGDAGTSPTDIRRSMNDIYGSPKLRKCNMVEVEITRFVPVDTRTEKFLMQSFDIMFFITVLQNEVL